jgi:uridine phosphorylase
MFRDIFPLLEDFNPGGVRFTNIEMETSAIFLLCKILGHQALSCNVILANRVNQTFSNNPAKAIDSLIQHVLNAVIS